MYLASTSLPAPVSPVSRMLLSAGEIRVRKAKMPFIAALSAITVALLDILEDKKSSSSMDFCLDSIISRATSSVICSLKLTATTSATSPFSSRTGLDTVRMGIFILPRTYLMLNCRVSKAWILAELRI